MIQLPQYIHDFLVSSKNQFDSIRKSLETIAKAQSLKLEEGVIYIDNDIDKIYRSKEDALRIIRTAYPGSDPEVVFNDLLKKNAIQKAKIL